MLKLKKNCYADLYLRLKTKQENSYISFKNNGFFYNVSKVGWFTLKVLFATSRKVASSHIILSETDFKKDLAKVPEETIEIKSLTLKPKDLLILTRDIFCTLYWEAICEKSDFALWQKIVVGRIYYLTIRNSRCEKVDFHYYAFKPEIYSLSFFCTLDDKIHFTFWLHMNFLDKASSIIANTLINEHVFSYNYCVTNSDVFEADEYLVRSNNWVSALGEVKQKNAETVENLLGYFSSGFMARKTSYLNELELCLLVKYEAQSLMMISRFCQSQPNLQLIIFPHYIRGVEDPEEVDDYYFRYAEMGAVIARPSEAADLKEKIALSVTNESNVFWDQLRRGRRAILMNNLLSRDFIVSSGLEDFASWPSTQEEANRFLESWLRSDYDEVVNKLIGDSSLGQSLMK